MRGPCRLPSELRNLAQLAARAGLPVSFETVPSNGTVEGGPRKSRTHQTSDQERLPAEFKHITKRRRRN